jgi:hypothetical protein
MEIEVGKLYKLNAQWHKRHGEVVEVVQIRESITKAYRGRDIYHVAYSPLRPEARTEDLDEEFIPENFSELVLDDDIELFDILEFFDDLPDDLVESVERIRDEEDLNSYVFLHDGFLEVTFGKDEDQARQDAYTYILYKNKIDEVFDEEETGNSEETPA